MFAGMVDRLESRKLRYACVSRSAICIHINIHVEDGQFLRSSQYAYEVLFSVTSACKQRNYQ